MNKADIQIKVDYLIPSQQQNLFIILSHLINNSVIQGL